MNFSVKLLEKNEGRFENELPGKIVCMGLAFTAAFFKVFTWICNKTHLTSHLVSHPFHQIAFSAVSLLCSNFIQSV